MKLRFFVPAAVLLLSACGSAQQSPLSSSEGSARPNTQAPMAETVAEPSPTIRMFEMHCYRTGADFHTIVAAAEVMKLKPIPDALQPLMAPQEGEGRGFVLEVEREGGKVSNAIMLGVSDLNACSVSSYGNGAESILEEARDIYRLRSVARDDLGLQVNELFVPDGRTGHMSEAHEKGLIGAMVAKPHSGSGDAITLSYLSPKAVKQHLGRD